MPPPVAGTAVAVEFTQEELFDLVAAFNENPSDDALCADLMARGCLAVTMDIENTYELYGTEWTRVSVLVPPEPADQDSAEYDDWLHRFILDHTGTGRTRGDAWYDITWDECSDPAQVGRTFDWGY